MALRVVTVEVTPTLLRLARPIHAVYAAALRDFGAAHGPHMMGPRYASCGPPACGGGGRAGRGD
eukprot:gene4716-32710_t